MFLIILTGCGPSPEEALQATTTKVAEELYGTQTAQAPAPDEAVGENQDNEDSSPEVETPADSPLRTPTPLSPRTLSDEDQRWMACYQAAVTIEADWAVHEHILAPYLANSSLDRNLGIQVVNQFSWYRNNRSDRITIEDPDALFSFYLLDGEQFPDCPLNDIMTSRSFLDYHPWMPEGMGPSKSPPPIGQTSSTAMFEISTGKKIIHRVVAQIRQYLIAGRHIDTASLIAAEKPIWLSVHNDYGVSFPEYLQGEAVQQ